MSDQPIATISTKKSIERRVIFLYKSNPFLWKTTHPRYSDSGLKRYALERISLHLNLTKLELISHIKIITNRINQIVKNFVDAEAKGGVVVMDSKYEHFVDCQFLFDELLRRRRKRNETKQRSTPADIQSVSDRLLCESWIFAMVMDHYHTLGASEDNQINWDEISHLVNIKASFKMTPAIARNVWANLSKSIFETYRQIKEAHQETPSGFETVWDALEKLVNYSGMVLLSLYFKSILKVYVKKTYNYKYEDNQFLFGLISKYPCIMRKSKKDKKDVKQCIWDEITKSYNRRTNNQIEATLLRRQWNHLLRKIEGRMKIFNNWMKEDSDSVTICAPTDLEKNILKCYPRLLFNSLSSSSVVTPDGKSYFENEGFEEIRGTNKDADNSILTEEIDNPESTDKILSSEEKASSRLEIFDINIGAQDYAYMSEINKDFLDDLEINHITSGINSPEDQLSDEDVSFLLVKWLGQDLTIKEKIESDLTSYNIHSEIWESLAEKILPFSSLQTPENLYSRWRDIFMDTLRNLQFSERRLAEMTSMNWIVLQSFPNLFMKAEGSEDLNSNNDFVHTSVEDSSQSQSSVPQHNKDIPERSNSQSSMDDDDRSHDSSGGLHMSDTKLEQSTYNKDLPELKRHQKPIILSDKTEVLKMNRQLQTASVAPLLSTKRAHKMVILKKCEKDGQIKDLLFSWTDCRAGHKPDKNKLSYRPNPKYSKGVPDWMKKSIALFNDALPTTLKRKEDAADKNKLSYRPNPKYQPTPKFRPIPKYRPNPKYSKNVPEWMKKSKVVTAAPDDALPALTPRRKEDVAYQHFLEVLQSFSKSKAFLKRDKATNDEIFTTLALHESSNAPPKVVFKSKDLVISDSDDNCHDILLDFSNEMDAELILPQKKTRKTRVSKKKKKEKDYEKEEIENNKINEDCNKEIVFYKNPLIYKKNLYKKMQASEECNSETVYLKNVSNSKNSKVVTSDVLSDSDSDSDWFVNKKSVKRTRKYKSSVKKQLKLSQCESVNQHPDHLIVKVSNNLPSTNMVLNLENLNFKPLLNSTLEVPIDPIPPPASDVVSQVPEPCNLDLRSYYSMVADSLLDMSNLDDVEMGKSNEITDNSLNCNPALDFVIVSNTLPNELVRSLENLPNMSTSPPQKMIETISLSDSDDDVPLAQFIKQSKE